MYSRICFTGFDWRIRFGLFEKALGSGGRNDTDDNICMPGCFFGLCRAQQHHFSTT